MNGFYCDIDAVGPSIAHLGAAEHSQDSIKLKICGRKLMIAVSGEPSGKLLLERFQEGLARKLLQPGMLTLVDMTKFIGVVDWQAMAKLREMAYWSEDKDHPPKTAYLLREAGAALLVKAVGALFPGSEHRIFTRQADAIAWLET